MKIWIQIGGGKHNNIAGDMRCTNKVLLYDVSNAN